MTGISAYSSGLQNSRQANSTLASSINNVATGKKVNSAADNAAYWAIATTMTSDHKALSSVGDALALGAAVHVFVGMIEGVEEQCVSALFGAVPTPTRVDLPVPECPSIAAASGMAP